MIYLNNAATTYPKPPAVLRAWQEALAHPPANAFRSTEAEGGDVMTACRTLLGQALGIADASRIYFSSGATESINKLLLGLQPLGLPVLATLTEHNSVLRPLHNLPGLAGAQLATDSDDPKHEPQTGGGVLAPASPSQWVSCTTSGLLCLDDLEDKLRRLDAERGCRAYACLLVVNHCSNVTGAVQDIGAIARIAHRHHALLMVDAAQSAGCLPVRCDAWGVDLLAFTGHKGLFGPQGTGGYYVRRGIDLRPVFYGGTGRDSSRLTYADGAYEYEVGTQNLPGIAALSAGVRYVLERGVECIMAHEHELMSALRQGLGALPRVTVYGRDDDCTGPLLSLNVSGMTPFDVGFILHNAYGITVRTGLHCSPLIHRALGTAAEGTVRISVSDLTTRQEVEALVRAVGEIAASSGEAYGADVKENNDRSAGD